MGGRVWLVGRLVGGGGGEGYPAVQVHRGTMAKRVCSCHGTQCFQRNSRSEGGRGGGKRTEKKKEESVGHMSPFARSLACPWQDVMLNVEVRG